MGGKFDHLGDPSVRLGPLCLWVHGRQFAPDTAHAEDRDWLVVTAHCGADGSEVTATGPFLLAGEVATWRAGVAALSAGAAREADLLPLEPYLAVRLRARSLGHLDLEIDITPEPLTQRHHYSLEIDQTYLPLLRRDLDAVLRDYPVLWR